MPSNKKPVIIKPGQETATTGTRGNTIELPDLLAILSLPRIVPTIADPFPVELTEEDILAMMQQVIPATTL